MKKTLPFLGAVLGFGLTMVGASVAAATEPGGDEVQWHAFPDESRFQVLGLPWFEQNQPKFWRMPAKAMDGLPKGVQGRAKSPSGGRIVLRSTTTRLALRARAVNSATLARFDTYVNGRAHRPVVAGNHGTDTELVLFEGLGREEKEIVVYLPHRQEVVVTAIGGDAAATFQAAGPSYVRPRPVVFYGSSVCQGSGASGPTFTYPAVLGRELNLDFVNLGFGGAGKAEPVVVDRVNALPASAFVFDLGKSYGAQDATAFKLMLQRIRQSHPGVPMIVITPITSVKELKEQAYSERSIHTRQVMRAPVQELIAAGERQLFLVEGEALVGFKEHDLLSKDGVHPADRGYGVIAARLAPVLRQALGL
jgi:lysophospholipase L1-like esterase